MNFKSRFKNGFLLSLLIAFFSCQHESDNLQFTGQIEFTFNSSKSLTGKDAKNDIESARYVLVKITKQDGEVVLEREKLELYKFGDEFISEPLALNPGNYQLTEFLILDENEVIIFASPLQGSDLASSVSQPLPFDFEIAQDVTIKLTPEVISTTGEDPEAFGYTTFGFDVVSPFDFRLSVFIYDYSTENFELTEATLSISDSTGVLQSQELESKTNLIELVKDSDHYTLVIEKEGFPTYSQEFSSEELDTYKNDPLIVVLNEGNMISLQPGPQDGKDATVGFIIPNENRGDIDFIAAYAWTQDGILNINRNFIDFDVYNAVKNADEIEKAYLYLYYHPDFPAFSPFGKGHHGDNAMYVERVTSPWEENTVTWNTQPTVDLGYRIFVPSSTSKTQDYKIDVTGMVKEMVTNPESSYGFSIRLVVEDPYRIVILTSSDFINPDLRPKLEIIKK